MNFVDILGNIIVASVSAIIGVFIAVFVWLIRMGSRVTLLENGYANVQRSVELEQRALANGIRDIRTELQVMNKELVQTKETWASTFAPSDDFRRLEDKVDSLREELWRRPPPKGRRASVRVRKPASQRSE